MNVSCQNDKLLTSKMIHIILSFFLFSSFVSSYYTPIQPYLTSQRRTNLCPVAQKVLSGELMSALQGQNLSVAIHYNTPTFYMRFDNNTGQPTGGYIYDLQQTLASTYNFNFHYILVPDNPPSPGLPSQDWTTRLRNITAYVDLYGNNAYSDTTSRRASGLDFPSPITDASVVLVTVQHLRTIPSNTWSFFFPFTWDLWGLILGVILINGVLNWIFNKDGKEDAPLTIYRSIYLSFSSFTGAEPMDPRGRVSSLLNIGYAFLLLILVSSYTANLASTFISQLSQQQYISSIQDAIQKNVFVCAATGSNALSVLQTYYPNVKVLILPSTSTVYLLQQLRTGVCSGAVMQRIDWLINENNILANPSCDLVQAGPELAVARGSWPFRMDMSDKCTSILGPLLSFGLDAMHQNNTLTQIFDSNIRQYSTIDCVSLRKQALLASALSSGQLSLKDLSGVFYFYAFSLALALVVGVFTFLRMYLEWRAKLGSFPPSIREEYRPLSIDPPIPCESLALPRPVQ